jgi:hypothetical protein
MDQMFLSYEAYVTQLQTYLREKETQHLPNEIADSQANQALMLNLADYAKFAPYYPATPERLADLQRSARAAQDAWLRLFPHE